ncbi:hypothetical protein FACS189434_10210 [Bacteroidia bacterium]|nr:hypothetical protein FACS189434_10210 [Bacteroidia bacterium]
MKRYVEQLVEILQEAYSNKPQPRYMELPEEMECLRGIIELEKSIDEGEEYTMENIFGVPQNYFPPEDRLTDEQVKTLLNAILELWHVFHYEADFRRGEFTEREQYAKLVEHWKETAPKMRHSNGTWHFEMFDYEQYWDENEMCYLTEDEYWAKHPIPHFDWEDEK